MTAPVVLDLAAFTALQLKVERAGMKLRRSESCEGARYFVKSRGVCHELRNADDVEALIAQVAAAATPPNARA